MLLETKELIENLKDKGVKFNFINEDEAMHFLEEHNYYIKIASYRHNYDKDNKGKYINLDFFHLKELSTIDMHLKFLIIKTCLNIEHSLKVNFLNHIQKKNVDDIKLANEFLNNLESKKIKMKDELERRRAKDKNKDLYTGSLLNKFEHPNYPIWVLMEVMSFGNLVKLIDFYCGENNCDFADINLLYRVRSIRNAAAHSNCLIHNLKDRDKYYIEIIYNYLANKLNGYKRHQIQRHIRNTFIHDFCCLIMALDIHVKSDEIKDHRIKEFIDFLECRAVRNKDMFMGNDYIIETYKFIKNLLDITI